VRIVKDSEVEYSPFVGTMDYSKSRKRVHQSRSKYSQKTETQTGTDELEKIISFEKTIDKTDTIMKAAEELNAFLQDNLDITNAQLFFFNKSKTSLNPVGANNSGNITSFIKHLNKEGSIDWIFESNSASNFVELITYTVNDKVTKIIIIPIFQKSKRKGILLLTTSDDIFLNNERDFKLVNAALRFTLTKMESLLYKYQVKEVTKELQTYQSKSLNDNRLLAVGEMAITSIEEILNPMQVILSYTDMMRQGSDISNSDALRIIKEQVNTVTKVISGLMKFATRKEESSAIQPTNVNTLIQEFYKVIFPTVRNKNYELILDLQDDIPMIISNRDYVFQLLTNVFAIILSGKNSDGGILLQTKFNSNFISVRVVSTSYLDSLDKKSSNPDSDLSIGIVKKLMEQHEGYFQTTSNPNSGTTLILNFPIQRQEK
jgi:K+-sensing histidine kinase KdpD